MPDGRQRQAVLRRYQRRIRNGAIYALFVPKNHYHASTRAPICETRGPCIVKTCAMTPMMTAATNTALVGMIWVLEW